MNKIYPWQKGIWNKLTKSLNGGQKYITIHGSHGHGKSSLATQLSKYVLCQSPKRQMCNMCSSCNVFESNAHPSFLCVNSNPRIETTLSNKVWHFIQKAQKLGNNSKKVILIQAAHLISRIYLTSLLNAFESSNLTENMILILTANSLERIPRNIIRKSKVIKLHSSIEPKTIDWVIKNTDKETNAILLMKLARYAPLKAVKYYKLGYLNIRDKALNHILLYITSRKRKLYNIDNLYSVDAETMINVFLNIASDLIGIKTKPYGYTILNFDVAPLLGFFSDNSSEKKLQDYLFLLQNLFSRLQNGVHFNTSDLYRTCIIYYTRCVQKN